MKQTSRLLLDDAAQLKIGRALSAGLEDVGEEKIRLMGREVVTCIVVPLDETMRMRVSVNGGFIRVSVGDGTVQIQKREWRRGKLDSAVNWCLGYEAGYTQ